MGDRERKSGRQIPAGHFFEAVLRVSVCISYSKDPRPLTRLILIVHTIFKISFSTLAKNLDRDFKMSISLWEDK